MPKISDSFKRFFSRKSKKTEATPEMITMEGNLEELGKEVEKSAELFKKQGDVKTAEKWRDIPKKLKGTPGKAIKELEALLKKAKLSPEAKQELKALLEKFKESFKKLLNSINVKTQHNKHVEKVVINFYKMVNEILKKEYFRICDYGIRTHIMSACKDNVAVLILGAIDESGIGKYAITHKPSVINKWYKYLLKYIKMASEYLDEQVRILVFKNNNGNKDELLSELFSTQKALCAALLGVLNLKQYVRNHKIENSSLGFAANGDKYKESFASTERTLKSYMNDSICEKMCGDLLGLGPAFDSEPVELY